MVGMKILVVDDGSDVPPEWLGESFGQQNVRLIMAPHGGPGAARNRGLAEARGEYIQFVDADDSLVPGAFGACVEMLRNEKPDILQHGYRECCTEEQMMQGVEAGNRVLRIVDRGEAIRTAVMMASAGDIILVAGKGHETYQIIGREKHHFDDREVLRAAFAECK